MLTWRARTSARHPLASQHVPSAPARDSGRRPREEKARPLPGSCFFAEPPAVRPLRLCRDHRTHACVRCAWACSSATKQLRPLRKALGTSTLYATLLSGGLLCPMLKTSAARRRLHGRRTPARPVHAGARLRCAEDGTGHGGTEGFTHCVTVADAEAWRGACTRVPGGRADVCRVRLRRNICALPL